MTHAMNDAKCSAQSCWKQQWEAAAHWTNIFLPHIKHRSYCTLTLLRPNGIKLHQRQLASPTSNENGMDSAPIKMDDQWRSMNDNEMKNVTLHVLTLGARHQPGICRLKGFHLWWPQWHSFQMQFHEWKLVNCSLKSLRPLNWSWQFRLKKIGQQAVCKVAQIISSLTADLWMHVWGSSSCMTCWPWSWYHLEMKSIKQQTMLWSC